MKVLICAAGSGGHIYPALAVAAALQRMCAATAITFLSTRRQIEQEIFQHSGYPVIAVAAPPLPQRNGRNTLFFCLRIFAFLLQLGGVSVTVTRILARERPDIVVGFGAWGSCIPVMVAAVMRIPAVIHEQNVLPGRANRFLASWCSRIAVGHAQTARYFRRPAVITGNPLRPGITARDPASAAAFFGLKHDGVMLLVFGGSQGSRFINTAVAAAVGLLDPRLRQRLRLLHIAGAADCEMVQGRYAQLQVTARVFAYLHEIDYAYSAGDLVICRAGAATLNELAFFGLPALLIPYPYAQAHQVENARVVEQAGAAVLIAQDDHAAQRLAVQLTILINDENLRQRMAQASRMFYEPSAAEKIAAVVRGASGRGSSGAQARARAGHT
ncbi:MAG: undecaprenyldiphospho-muramoylpentapeptide beta-N-acetylglucosaminyltransferase [Candidatus Omnitrophica bacterium]|nr:undecaprenyldiphospho-muramoylpentapeptide beta-N-acetylglucosaminyltransferase [Candidatus Omnitrophota bacterium]